MSGASRPLIRHPARGLPSADRPRDTGQMGRVYLRGLGLREAGVKLDREVQGRTTGPTLRLRTLVATSEGTDIEYDLDGVAASPKGDIHTHESIIVRSDGQETELASGMVGIWGAKPTWRRSMRSLGCIPITPGRVEIEISLSGVGTWRLTAELVRYGENAESQQIEVSDTREGITVQLHSWSVSDEFTAVELSAAAREDGVRVEGIGALTHSRLGANALVLRDQELRRYGEVQHVHMDSSSGDRSFAVFPALMPNARRVELEVPYVYVHERYEQVTLELPVKRPRRVAFGRYPALVLRTFTTSGNPDAPNGETSIWSAVGVDVDLGGWRDSRRMLAPVQAFLDGARATIRHTYRLDTSNPAPLHRFDVATEHPGAAVRLTLLGALVEVYGPWSIKFERKTVPGHGAP